jgi:hypothetical protein
MKPLRGWLPWAGCLLALIAVPWLGSPRWQLNDDIAMAMVAHGYGMVAEPDARLVFSNALYGELLRRLPEIGGIQAYGIATYALLLLACAAICFALRRADAPAAPGAAVVLTAFLPALLYPQFTLVAGLLAAAGVLQVAARPARESGLPRASLALAAALLVAASLVRLLEALFVVAVSTPFLLQAWRAASGALRARMKIALALTAGLIAACVAYDRAQYLDAGWQEFATVNAMRALFTDFGYAQYLVAHSPARGGAGLTYNDLLLLYNFFYADPNVFSAERMTSAARAVPLPALMASNILTFDEKLVDLLAAPHVLALLALVAIAAWRRRASWSPLAWALALLATATLVALAAGRPGESRIYVPPLAAIALLVLLAPAAREPWLGLRAAAPLAVAAIVAATLAARHAHDRLDADAARAALCGLPADKVYVVWGGIPALEDTYRPLEGRATRCGIRLYSIGVFSRAPYMLDMLRRETGAPHLAAALLAGTEMELLGHRHLVALLNIFMREHYGRPLRVEIVERHGYFTRYRIRIEPP